MKLSKEIYVMGTFTVKDSKGKEYSLWELSTLKKDKVEQGQKFYKDTSVRRTAIQGLTNTTEDATTKRNSMRDDDIIIDDIIVFLLAMTLIIISKEMHSDDIHTEDIIVNQKNYNKND